jgi:3-phosphoshikimate 1-carboxyvinyltransferase
MIRLFYPQLRLKGEVRLPLSKSECNRLQILQWLSRGRIHAGILSESRDSLILKQALESSSELINIGDAGTAMRFLTAAFCLSSRDLTLTGSERMQQRPIGPLVEALRQLGFRIEYSRRSGFPPLHLLPSVQTQKRCWLETGLSSQFTSALLLSGAFMPLGLEIVTHGHEASSSYTHLTLSLLNDCGIRAYSTEYGYRVEPLDPEVKNVSMQAGADWSSAAYWYALAAMSKETDLLLCGLSPDTAQADRRIMEWFSDWGIESKSVSGGILLSKNPKPLPAEWEADLSENPDQAQTLIPLAAALGIRIRLCGLETLRHKETDRISAMQEVLRRAGCDLEEWKPGCWQLSGKLQIPGDFTLPDYGDHRMLLGFACWAALASIQIENPEVAGKSYPAFWQQLQQLAG